MEKDTKEEGKISCSGVTIGFFIGAIVIIVAICLWEKFYTPPQVRMDAQKVADQKAQEEKKKKAALKKRADHAKSSVRQEKNSREEKVLPPAVIALRETVEVVQPPPTKWVPVIGVSGDTKHPLPRFRFARSESATQESLAGNNTTTVVVVEAPSRKDRYDYVYGAFGNNCGWGGCGNSGIYCNSYGNSGWPCPQYQNNFVNQAPPFVPPPTVFVQTAPAPTPPHHEHHHRRHHEQSTPPHSGGPAERKGF